MTKGSIFSNLFSFKEERICFRKFLIWRVLKESKIFISKCGMIIVVIVDEKKEEMFE